jgi:hypothetical protein
MKKAVLLLAVSLLAPSFVFSQNTQETQPPVKTSQAALPNDLYIGYGALSIFYFTGRMRHSQEYPTDPSNYTSVSFPNQPSSPGTFYLGYSRSLNKVVSVGFMFGYQSFSYTGTGHHTDYGKDSVVNISATDQLVTGIARFTFCYLNKPFVRMYSGIGIGLTIDFGKATANGVQSTERKLWPGGQLTLMGLRFGRSFGGFLEFGFGSYGILNAGLSYKFSD